MCSDNYDVDDWDFQSNDELNGKSANGKTVEAPDDNSLVVKDDVDKSEADKDRKDIPVVKSEADTSDSLAKKGPKDTHSRTANARAMSALVRTDWHEAFYEAFLELGRITLAAKKIGIARSAVHRTINENEAFAERFEDIKAERKDMIEAEIERRAMAGSDKLLMFMAEAEMPEKYRANSNMSINLGAEIVVDLTKKDDGDGSFLPKFV